VKEDAMAKKKASKRKRRAKKATPARSTSAANAKKPALAAKRSIDDSTLGEIVFANRINPCLDEYAAEVEVAGSRVQVMLLTDDHLDLKSTIRRAKEILRRYATIEKRARKYLLENVLQLHNEAWREEEEPLREIDSLLEQMTLMEITVHADGKATFWYGAGELFRGHLLLLRMDSSTQITDHDLAG
jgi:hypothetical protein